ncbi:hypothetical protein D3C84_1105110 [compost metagenome]
MEELVRTFIEVTQLAQVFLRSRIEALVFGRRSSNATEFINQRDGTHRQLIHDGVTQSLQHIRFGTCDVLGQRMVNDGVVFR